MRHWGVATFFASLLALAWPPAHAAGCTFETAGEVRVAEIRDAATLRLEDGREVRLAGIIVPPGRTDDLAVVRALRGRMVMLQLIAPNPDRYGRLLALVRASDAGEPVQAALLRNGAALASGDLGGGAHATKCLREFLNHEAVARNARRGYWTDPSAIKNAERSDDISPWIGQFIVVEGKIASVREAGATVYVNFGRRWTRDFAVAIPRRMVRGFEAAGMPPKSLESKTVRVRGWVELRTGPRIEAFAPGQIEVMR